MEFGVCEIFKIEDVSKVGIERKIRDVTDSARSKYKGVHVEIRRSFVNPTGGFDDLRVQVCGDAEKFGEVMSFINDQF